VTTHIETTRRNPSIHTVKVEQILAEMAQIIDRLNARFAYAEKYGIKDEEGTK